MYLGVSERVFEAVGYLLFERPDGTVNVVLVLAKMKVALVKYPTFGMHRVFFSLTSLQIFAC